MFQLVVVRRRYRQYLYEVQYKYWSVMNLRSYIRAEVQNENVNGNSGILFLASTVIVDLAKTISNPTYCT